MAKAIVMLDIAKGRRELGWEVGWADVGGTTDRNPTAGIVVDNDADIVVKRIWAMQFGAGSPIALPDSIKLQIKDGPTALPFFRQPGRVGSFCQVPWVPMADAVVSNIGQNGRFMSNDKGMAAPYLLRRGSSLFFEMTNATGYTFQGDVYFGLEGFRVYPGEGDPVPSEIKGFNLPYVWNGTVDVAAGLPAGLQKLGTIEAPGPGGKGSYYLKAAAISATGRVAQVATTFVPPVDHVLALQVRDSMNRSKEYFHMTSQPTLGSFMPACFFTGGGAGIPWIYPKAIDGTSKVFIDVYGDPSSFVGSAPGEIEVCLHGVQVPL